MKKFLRAPSREEIVEPASGAGASEKQVLESVVPIQYRERSADGAVNLPFRVSKFLDYGGTGNRQQINTMSVVAYMVFSARPQWFPSLSEYQPVPRDLNIKRDLTRVAQIVFEKGVNDYVLESFLSKSDSIQDLVAMLERTQNRRTLYRRTPFL